MAIRVALGAATPDVVWAVIADGMRPAMLGIGIGLAAAVALARLLASILYGVQPREPATFVAVAIVRRLVALMATLLTARRATRVHPMRR